MKKIFYMIVIMFIFLLLLIYSNKSDTPCSSHKVMLDVSNVRFVKKATQDISQKFDLKMVEANESDLKFPIANENAFITYLYVKDDEKSWIMSISYLVGNELNLSFYNNGNMALDELHRLFTDFVDSLGEVKGESLIKIKNDWSCSK